MHLLHCIHHIELTVFHLSHCINCNAFMAFHLSHCIAVHYIPYISLNFDSQKLKLKGYIAGFSSNISERGCGEVGGMASDSDKTS